MKINPEYLDAIFGALADPTRRQILERLSHGPANITELGAPFAMSQPAISKHMKILDRAGLVSREKEGRCYQMKMNPEPLEQAMKWVKAMKSFWEGSFDGLTHYLENNHTTLNPDRKTTP